MTTHKGKEVVVEWCRDSVPGYREGIVKANVSPLMDETGNRWFDDVDGWYINVHPYRYDLGGYPVRWASRDRRLT